MKVWIIVETRNHPYEYTDSCVMKVFDCEAKARKFLDDNPNHKDGYEDVTYECRCKELE